MSNRIAEVEYDPLLVVLGHHDAEWSRQMGKDHWSAGIGEVVTRIQTKAHAYGNGVVNNYRRFTEANTGEADLSIGLEPHLYDPICCVAIGHADVFSLTLCDDFDPVHDLTVSTKTTLERLWLGFAPNVKSLGVDSKTFVSLPQIWQLRKEGGLPPMVVFCRLKMDGLGAIGLGFEFQSALWRTIVTTAEKVAKALDEPTWTEHQNMGIPPMFSHQDIATMKCSLLDLQGCEEMGLLIFCQNLTPAFAIVRAIRQLTYDDVVKTHPKLKDLLESSRVHGIVMNAAVNRERERGRKSPAELLRHNHVIRWSESSVALVTRPTQESKRELFAVEGEIHGMVSANSRFQVPPGHRSEAINLIEHLNQNVRQRNLTMAGLGPKYSPYTVGHFDMVTQHIEEGTSHGDTTLVRTSSVVGNLQHLMQRICESDGISKSKGRDVVYFETELSVPVPNLPEFTDRPIKRNIGPEREGEHVAPLCQTLPLLTDRLCYGLDSDRKTPGALDIAFLQQSLCQLGAPVTFRRTVEYLYDNFAIALRDPYAFDAVLDLYDGLATFSAAVTRKLVHSERGLSISADPMRPRQLISRETLARLVDIVESLHNALAHRTSNVFRDLKWHDAAVDFRGGLNQMLHAADVPLKCGLGMLRYVVSPDKNLEQKAAGTFALRNKFGGVIRIGLEPGIFADKHPFSDAGSNEKDGAAYFADVHVDVPHIVHIASYVDHIHEALHLVFEEISERQGLQPKWRALDDVTRTRVEEIFAQLCTRLFVFGEDRKSFLYNTVLSYSRDAASFGSNDEDTLRRCNELFATLYFAADCYPELKHDEAVPKFKPLENVTIETEERYIAFVREIGKYFSESTRFWKNDKHHAWDRTLDHMREFHETIREYAPLVWSMGYSLLRGATKVMFPEKNAEEISQIKTQLRDDVKQAFATGKPLVWCGKGKPIRDLTANETQTASKNIIRDSIDPLLFVCGILGTYISSIQGSDKFDVHLRRDLDRRLNVSYATKENWWKFQADKGAAAMFCCIPAERSKRLLKQIVVMKSFWDLSSELRARRFLEMLKSNGFVE